MSYQHFYSRVPARVSYFNKRDGFDTFAYSAELDRDFILGELATVYAGKLDIHDPVRVRRGEIPTVYSQAYLPSGRLVQTAIKYLPTDFTGERSAYLAHSLVLTDEETDRITHSTLADVINPDMFITDISRFNLTDRGAMPNSRCPEANYIPRPIINHKAKISSYNPEMMKSFIYAVLSAALEGGRSVYFRLPVADSMASDASVDFINAILNILPFGVREKMSFVSYVSTPLAYPGFTLKGVGSSFVGVAPEDGVFFDFSSGVVTGQQVVKEQGINISSFLYSLFDYKKIRDEFLPFVQRIVDSYEDITLNIKTLKDIAFLFWQCSGFYVEKTILPNDDSISRFFDIYERFRAGLITDHRVQAYRCLGRYSEAQIAIPDSVFSRISRLYPDECVEAKAVALDVLLKLIHVDLMRDSLFCFISRNYPKETEGVKAVVVANLVRVFYGGFLQQNILAFFDMYFRREPVNTRDIILDKLLLSIRTPEVSGHIVVFLDRHYSALNAAQRLKVCTTCLEMLPECDQLSALLISLINRRISRDTNDIRGLMDAKLYEMLGAQLSIGDNRLASMFIENPGFCEDVVLKYALNQQPGSDIVIGMLAAMPGHRRADKLIRACQVAEGLEGNLYLELLFRFGGVMVAIWPSTLDEILERDAIAEQTVPADLIELFRQVVIYPAILYTIYQVFSMEGNSGIDRVIAYAEKNPYVASSLEYRMIVDYLEIIRKCDLGDIESAFKHAVDLPESAELRGAIANHLKANAYKPDTQDAETTIGYELIINYLSTSSFGFGELYSKYTKYFEDSRVDAGGLKTIMADRMGAQDAIELLLSAASEICEADDRLASIVVDNASGLKEAIKSYISLFGFASGILLKKLVKEAHFEIEELVLDTIEDCK